jgi:hypothetical protein
MTRRAKGTNLLMLVKLARAGKRAGQLQGLDEDQEKLLEEHILVSEWYSFDAFAKLLVSVHEQMLGGTDEAAMRMGDAAAGEMLTGVHNMFVTKGDPARTATGLTVIWSRYFDFGNAATSVTGDNEVELHVTGYEDISRCHGLVLMGWVRTAVSLSGAEVASLDVVEAPWEGGRDLRVRARWS